MRFMQQKRWKTCINRKKETVSFYLYFIYALCPISFCLKCLDLYKLLRNETNLFDDSPRCVTLGNEMQ